MVLSSIIDALIILMYIWTFFETLFPGGKRITIAMGCSRGHHRSEVFDSIRVSQVLVCLLTLKSIVATARKQMNRENDKPSLTSTYALCTNFMFASQLSVWAFGIMVWEGNVANPFCSKVAQSVLTYSQTYTHLRRTFYHFLVVSSVFKWEDSIYRFSSARGH